MGRHQFPIPFGWFYIGEDADLGRGQIVQIRRFGRDLILWRGEDGAAHLQDAYCPHLGANIAVGGKVIGNTVQCPFHRWSFNGDGSVADIPYASKVNDRACLTTYRVALRYGIIMAWYHPAGLAPVYELPPAVAELDTGAYAGPIVTSHLIRSPLQEMAENVVDGAHFESVHGHPGAASYDGVTYDGAHMHVFTKQVFPSSRGPVEGTLSSESWGYGFAVVRYSTVIRICMITVNAPIETDYSIQLFRVYWENPEGDEKIDRIGRAFSNEVNRQLEQDTPIWEAKIYRPRPYLTEGEVQITRFRAWARQFYYEWAETAGPDQKAERVEA